jgi:hypothetical protein
MEKIVNQRAAAALLGALLLPAGASVCAQTPAVPARTFSGHTAQAWGLAFTPDGKSLVSGSFDKTLRV